MKTIGKVCSVEKSDYGVIVTVMLNEDYEPRYPTGRLRVTVPSAAAAKTYPVGRAVTVTIEPR